MAQCVPALHQLLGFAEHLVPVLQFFATSIHVGAHHHPAQLATFCRGGKALLFSGRGTEPHHLGHPQCLAWLSLSLPPLLPHPSFHSSHPRN